MRHSFRRMLLVLLIAAGTSQVQAQFTGVTASTAPGLNVPQTLTTDQTLLYPQNREMQLMPGDLIEVKVYNVTPEYDEVERVALDGTVRLNLLGVASVTGMSLKEAELKLSKQFEDAGQFHNAQISIIVNDAPSHIVTLMGEVKATAPVIGNRRLFDVIAASGGLPTTASTVITVERPGVETPIVVDLGNDPAHSRAGNIPIFAGDTIITGRVGSAYVVGAVTKPGIVPLNGATPTTVTQALAASGGLTFPAVKDQTKLVRTVGTQRTVIDLHLKAMEKGTEPDIALQSNDVILVPSNTFRSIIKSGYWISALAVGVTAIAVLH
jgi:polysaccharide export outer membrane protein